MKISRKIFAINFWFGYIILMLLLAVRSEFPFVDKMSFKGCAIAITVLLIADTVFDYVLKYKKVLPKAAMISLCAKLAVLALVIVIYYMAYFYIIYYAVEFAILLAYTLPVLFILSLILGKKRNTAVALVLAGVFIVGGFFSITKVMPSGFKVGAVVYAVGDEYQIVWSTYNRGVSYVEADGERYYDSTAGRADTDLTVHKVSVPMTVLDNAKSYTVFTKNMLFRNAYGALQGRTISRTYGFRPVDESDGVQYFALADVHDFKGAAVRAASYYGDSLDFLVVAGDISSFIPRKFSLEFINKLAFDITRGTRPVIYTRGNHETRGNLSNLLYNYVGAAGEDEYYYTFKLGSVWGVVLDTAEDKPDTNWEYYGAADYEAYRQKQISFLNGIIANADEEYNAPDVKYRIAVAHSGAAYVGYEDDLKEVFFEITERLNVMDIDIMVSGHNHQLLYLEANIDKDTECYFSAAYKSSEEDRLEPDIITTGANFATAVVSCHSDKQIYKEGAPFTGEFSGAALEYKDGKLVLKYINDKGEVLDIISPWFDTVYGKEITVKTFA